MHNAAWKPNNRLHGLREGPLWPEIWDPIFDTTMSSCERRRPNGPEDGTVIWLCWVWKCKCLCSCVYTFVPVKESRTPCLPACLLCHKQHLVHPLTVKVYNGSEITGCRGALSLFCHLLCVCQLLLQDRPRPLNHQSLVFKLSVILLHERVSLNVKLHSMRLLKQPVTLISSWTSVFALWLYFFHPILHPV